MKVQDPVCGMTIEEKDASATSPYKGKTYYFCSTSCKDKFKKNSETYAPDKTISAAEYEGERKHAGISQEQKKETACPLCGKELFPEPHVHAAKVEWTCPMHPEVRLPSPGACPKCGMALEPVEPPAVSSRAEWTCPMHPEIVRDAPGACPICGMALEPRTVSLEEEENPELIDMIRRFKVSTVLTIPLVYIAMGSYVPAISPEKFIPVELLKWLELILATPAVLYGAAGRSSCAGGSRLSPGIPTCSP